MLGQRRCLNFVYIFDFIILGIFYERLVFLKDKYFCGNCLFIPPTKSDKYLISSLSYLNFSFIPPWLKKMLNLSPLKSLEIITHHPYMWQCCDLMTDKGSHLYSSDNAKREIDVMGGWVDGWF